MQTRTVSSKTQSITRAESEWICAVACTDPSTSVCAEETLSKKTQSSLRHYSSLYM